LTAFYTDSGVLPRSLLRVQEFRFSIHALVGGTVGEGALFFLAAAAALLLLVGVWARATTIASWLLLSSLDSRNPLLLNHGDELLRILLFWSIFLPLSFSGCPSAEDAKKRQLSVFTAALTIQVCVVYFFGALLKTDPSWGSSGTAIFSALSLEQFSTGFGRALLGWPRLLRVGTLCVYYLELLGPLLIFVPWRNRRIREAAIVAFVAIHLGIALTMKLGLFPWVSILGWIIILPTETIDSFQRRLGREPAAPKQRVSEPYKGSMVLRRTAQVFGMYLITAVLVWNIRGLNLKTEDVKPVFADGLFLMTQLDQRWNMFAPKPNYIRGWYVAPASLADGSQVDLMKDGEPFSWKRPTVMAESFPDFRWRKYLLNLWRPRFEPYRQGLSAYLRRQWDGAHPDALKVGSLKVYFVWEDLSAGGESPIRTTVISGN
jgi:hypothetical protein